MRRTLLIMGLGATIRSGTGSVGGLMLRGVPAWIVSGCVGSEGVTLQLRLLQTVVEVRTR